MQIPLRLAAWLFAACLSCVAAAAELPPFRNLGVNEGMPSSAISQMVQDRDGRLWFGTADGLARWDGAPVLGMPTCGMFSQATTFDLVLPRLLAGETLGNRELATLGHGGLLSREMAYRFPPYRANVARGELE